MLLSLAQPVTLGQQSLSLLPHEGALSTLTPVPVRNLAPIPVTTDCRHITCEPARADVAGHVMRLFHSYR